MSAFESDDVAVVQGEYCQGPGEITACVANSMRLVNDSDFADMVKAVTKTIGEAEINSPKVVFVICDTFSPEIDHTFSKMQRLKVTYDYEPNLYLLILDKHANCRNTKSQCTVVDDVCAMVLNQH